MEAFFLRLGYLNELVCGAVYLQKPSAIETLALQDQSLAEEFLNQG